VLADFQFHPRGRSLSLGEPVGEARCAGDRANGSPHGKDVCPCRFIFSTVSLPVIHETMKRLIPLVGLLFGCALAAHAVGNTDATAEGAQTQVQAGAPASQPDQPTPDEEVTGNWGGLRDRLEQEGLTFGLIWVPEVFRNFEGGKDSRDTVVASTADLNFTLDTDKAFDLPGGKFYIDLEDHAGQNPSDVLTGDLQVFDKLNSSPYFQIFELYYEQELFDKKLRLKVGKVDANSEFSVIDNGLDFIDSSTQVSPTVFVFPTTPDPMPGANVFFSPTEYFFASFGVYLANQTDQFLDFTGQPWAIQPTRNGLFWIGETGFKWEHAPLLGLDGNLKLGFWGHTGTFNRLDGSTQNGAEGFYAILDQTLWQPKEKKDDKQAKDKDKEDRGVRMFLEYGETDPDVSQIWQHVGGGVTWKGFLPQREDDEIGFSPQCAFISSQAALTYPYEFIMECFYQTKLTPWATFQPDLQYIVHPGGQYRNALVGTVRLSIQF